MIFRQLFDAATSSFTYLVADEHTHEAVLIDPVLEQCDRDLALVQQLGLTLVAVFETHLHADHITAAGKLREKTGARVSASKKGAQCIDQAVGDGDELRVGALTFRVRETPGHTDDSVSYVMPDRVFTGDALLIRTAGRTDFQNGDPGQLYDSITRVLFDLPDDTWVYPAHDYKGYLVSTIGEEKKHNARVTGRDRQAFVALMEGLHLDKPRNIDIALPANRACGRVEQGS